MLERILIAERGEAAVRIARTCRRFGIAAVAVSAGPDGADEPHVEACDDVVAVTWPEHGPVAPDVLVDAARRAKADAVHPGFARPHEHAALSQAVRDAGLCFVGARAEALEIQRDRVRLRAAAEAAEVRTVPWRGPLHDAREADRAADELGYPVLLKSRVAASGLGSRWVDDEDELADAFESLQAACTERFGEGALVVERAIVQPRVLELVVLADGQGGGAALVETEASLESGAGEHLVEAPSPLLVTRGDGESIRDAMADVAIRLARELGVVDVATVRFLVDPSARLHLLGLESGLPLHHAVVEMAVGSDLVDLQLRIAAGEALEQEIQALQVAGHAFEAEVRAEPTEVGGGPATVEELRWPPAPHGKVRAEPAVRVGSVVDAASRPLLVRIAAYAPIRHQALLSLDRLLAATQVAPLSTNVPLLRRVLGHEAFRAGQYDTAFANRIALT